MKKYLWLVVCLIFGVETATAKISIETRDEQLSNASQTQLRLRIHNGTGDTLENVELRYFLPEKPSATILEKHYLPGAEAEIVSQDSSMTVEGMWAGTIVAPFADLVLGQSSKTLYGRFLGKNVTVHQYATVHHVAFEPEMVTEVAGRGR